MKMKKLVAALIAAAAIAIAAPTAADAVGYTPGTPCSFAISVVQSGNTATLTCQPGTWAPSELVTWTGSGADGGNVHLASYRTAPSTVVFSKHANADGSDVLHVTLPADASGTYTITGVGQASGHVCSATLTVVPADTSGVVVQPGAATGQVADTGSTIAASVGWVGGGLVVAGLIVVAIAAWARRMSRS